MFKPLKKKPEKLARRVSGVEQDDSEQVNGRSNKFDPPVDGGKEAHEKVEGMSVDEGCADYSIGKKLGCVDSQAESVVEESNELEARNSSSAKDTVDSKSTSQPNRIFMVASLIGVAAAAIFSAFFFDDVTQPTLFTSSKNPKSVVEVETSSAVATNVLNDYSEIHSTLRQMSEQNARIIELLAEIKIKISTTDSANRIDALPADNYQGE